MPRVRLNKAKYESRRFSDMVRGELARKRIKQEDLAAYMGITQQALSYILRSDSWRLSQAVDALEYLELDFHIGSSCGRDR